LQPRLLVSLMRPRGEPALQYEIVVDHLNAIEQFREQGVGGEANTRAWLHELSSILLEPPSIEVLRIVDGSERDQAGEQPA
jgi:hypothetical protein